jgi:hypothetical protein
LPLTSALRQAASPVAKGMKLPRQRRGLPLPLSGRLSFIYASTQSAWRSAEFHSPGQCGLRLLTSAMPAHHCRCERRPRVACRILCPETSRSA